MPQFAVFHPGLQCLLYPLKCNKQSHPPTLIVCICNGKTISIQGVNSPSGCSLEAPRFYIEIVDTPLKSTQNTHRIMTSNYSFLKHFLTCSDKLFLISFNMHSLKKKTTTIAHNFNQVYRALTKNASCNSKILQVAYSVFL